MGFLFKKMRTIKNDEIQEKLKPYEQREKIQPLVMVVTIISREQSRYYLDAYQELGASLSLVFYSYSMPPEEYRNILGSDSTKKEIILTLVRGDLLNQVMDVARGFNENLAPCSGDFCDLQCSGFRLADVPQS